MFRFSSNIQQVRRSRHLHSRIHSLKKDQRFEAHFWKGGFLCSVGGLFVFFLNCLENPHCKEQATCFTLTTRRSKAFCFCHWKKYLKKKSRTEIQEWQPQNRGGRLSNISMQTSLSCLLFLAHFKHQIYVH